MIDAAIQNYHLFMLIAAVLPVIVLDDEVRARIGATRKDCAGLTLKLNTIQVFDSLH